MATQTPTNQTPANQTAAEKMQEMLLELQLKKLLKEQEEAEQQEAMARAARRIGADALNAQRQKELANQEACPHIKPNNVSALGGQRDHNNVYHWICAYCAKEWTQGEVPARLRVDMARVGGPNPE